MNACVWPRVVMETASACESLSEGNWISPKIREKMGGGRGLMHLSTALGIMWAGVTTLLLKITLLFSHSDLVLFHIRKSSCSCLASEDFFLLQHKSLKMCLMTFVFTAKRLALDGRTTHCSIDLSNLHNACGPWTRNTVLLRLRPCNTDRLISSHLYLSSIQWH